MTAYTVSSGFLAEVVKTSPNIARKFTIGTSDYSAFVTKWPTVNRKWNFIKPQDVSITLANQGQDFNFFQTDVHNMAVDCKIEAGIQFSTSSQELIELFKGRVGRVTYPNAFCTLKIYDSIRVLSDRYIGDNTAPIDFTNSEYSVGCMAWYILIQGGLEDVRSTSNVDIDYPSFLEWSSIFSADNINVKAYFQGIRATEALRKLGRLTQSSITYENGKVIFNRFSTSSVAAFDPGDFPEIASTLSLDERKIINNANVNADYDVNSKYFRIVVNAKNNSSINSFNLHSTVEKDSSIWYTNSVSALNLAQRLVDVNKIPFPSHDIKIGAQVLAKQVGETILVNNDVLNLTKENVRIMSYSINLETMQNKVQADASQLRTFFTLDDPTNGLLDQVYNPLG